jgi:hypothetical protein
MKINIKNSNDLNKLLDKLSFEIVDANIYHQLYRNLIDSIESNAKAFSQSNTFWSLTLNSLSDARMIRLCRVFDQQKNALNLYNFLLTIKANTHFFKEEHFRDRLKDNVFVDSLSEINRIPDDKQLDNDIFYSSKDNLLVKKLMIWRNNIIAHQGASITLGDNKILLDNPLSPDEIENILDEGITIINRYSNLYRASSFARKIIGHYDYKSLLKFINLGLEKHESEINKQIKKLKKSPTIQSSGPRHNRGR